MWKSRQQRWRLYKFHKMNINYPHLHVSLRPPRVILVLEHMKMPPSTELVRAANKLPAHNESQTFTTHGAQ